MNRIILSILLCLQLLGDNLPRMIFSVGGGGSSGGGEEPPPAASYLVEENFEGSGTPSGWTSAGTIDWDESTTYYQGAQSCEFTGTASDANVITPTFTASTDANIAFWFRMEAPPAGASHNLIQARNNTTTHETVVIGSAGKPSISGGSATADAIPNNTWVLIWFNYNAGTGASTLEFAADGVKVGSGSKFTSATQTATADINNFRIISDYSGTNSGPHIFIDRVIVDNSAIGSNP